MTDVPRVLTWATLLAHWTDFARASIALPTHGEGAKLRAAVPSLIGLQAVTHALSELNLLPLEEHAVALDRADILIRTYTADIASIWNNGPAPDAVTELISDASVALADAQAT